MTKDGKLVRDKIPEIIRSNGEQPVTRVLDEPEYKEALLSKLREEYDEFKADPNMEELADIQEVLGAICVAFGFNADEVEVIRQKKATERGRFNDRIFLERVEGSP